MNCPCPKHPFGCHGHPNNCGCEPSEIEQLRLENGILRDVLMNPDPDSEPDVKRLHREKCDALDEVYRLRSALEQIATRVAKKARNSWRIICPVCSYKSVEPHTEARHAPNCAGEIARSALGAPSLSQAQRNEPT